MSNLKLEFLSFLRDKNFDNIATAIVNNCSNDLTPSEKTMLDSLANEFRQRNGLTSHSLDIGFAGKMPVSGSPGRFIEIES